MASFDLISPERFQSKDTDWELCFICQKSEKETLISPVTKRGLLSFHTRFLKKHKNSKM